MTTALVVSRTFPSDDQKVHGVYQRLGIQVEALSRVVDRIECLFLVSATERYTQQAVEAHSERLSRRWSANVSVTVAAVVQPRPPVTLWEHYGAGVFDFHQQAIARDLDNEAAVASVRTALEARPDLVLVHRLAALGPLRRLAHRLGSIPVFFDLDDIEHVAAFRRLLHRPEWAGERLKLLQIPRLLLVELEAIARSRSTFVCSETDRRYLVRFVGSRHLEVVPNSIRFPVLDDADASEPMILFVGSMTYEPNALAADTLIREVWPGVRAQMPQAHLMIAGNRPDLIPARSSAPEGVTFTGFVASLDELYRRARVVCCPITLGAGTRVKIIEAAAHARAIVSTELGAEGLSFEDGKEIVLRREPAALADQCVRLLQDPAAARRLGTAALEKARRTYDRDAVLSQLERLFGDSLCTPLDAGYLEAAPGKSAARQPRS